MATTGTLTQDTTANKTKTDEYINQMYDANLASQKETLKQGYDANISALDSAQQQTQQQTDQNLTRTYVEAAKAAKNYGEVQNAYGLTSGAMAQAKLAQDTTLQQDLTALRGVQANADAELERQRALLGKEYMAAIQKAQADNDMQRAEALYKQAATEEQRLLETQQSIANLFAQKGDYSYLAKLWGLTDEQLAALAPQILSGGYSGGSSGGYGNGTAAEESSGASGSQAGFTPTYSTETSSSEKNLINKYNRL